MKNVITYLKTLWRRGLGSQSSDVSLDCRLTVGSPSVKCGSTLMRLVAISAFLLTIGSGNVWGDPKVSDLNFGTTLVNENFNSLSTCNNTPGNTKNGTAISSQTAYGVFTDGYVGKSTSIGFGIFTAADPFESKYLKVYGDGTKVAGLYLNNTSIPTAGAFDIYISKASVGYFGLFSAVDNANVSNKSYTVAYLYWDGTTLKISDGNTSSHSWQSVGTPTSDLIRVTVIYNESGSNTTYGSSISISNARAHVYVNGSAVMNGASPKEFTIATGRNPYYFRVTTTSSGGLCVDDLKIYNALPTAAASCSSDADMSSSAASLNGSFSLSSVGVTVTGMSAGSNCTWSEAGFVWSPSSNTTPTVGGTNCDKETPILTSGNATTCDGTLTGTFSTGNTYYYRAYGKNNYGSATYQYSAVQSFTPRSITFNLNGHGSSTPTTQYVNNGGKATDPSYSESVTGYTFGGWYKEAGCSNSWTFGTDVVSGANKTLYAKWTAKTYTIDLDQDLTPTSAGTTSISVTYNANTNLTSAITTPTKTGWTFAGYYTAKNGGGTQIIDADGNVLASKAGYTDASKNWVGTSDVTLYAKWTCTVTWSVNGATNVYDAQTLTYNGTSTKIASVPGPPNPASYCGDKFVGWTSVEDYVHGTSNLFTTVAGSPELKTVGDITFYAVFADYDE